jgi:hypothetical protein
LGCKSDPTTRDCGDQEPDYLLTVSSTVGVLPENTSVEVSYGGVAESYSLDQSGETHNALFCAYGNNDARPSRGAGGEGGAGPLPTGPTTLVCELYTLAAVAITVSGGDFEPVELSLAPDSDDCGAITVEAEIVLGEEVSQD